MPARDDGAEWEALTNGSRSEPEVVISDQALRHTPEPVRRVGGWHIQSVPLIDNTPVGGPTAVCHPYTGARLDRRFQCGHEARGGSLDVDVAVCGAIVSEGLRVGEHDDRVAAEGDR
jgi:hypothetical protein